MRAGRQQVGARRSPEPSDRVPVSDQQSEITAAHTRLLKCALCIDESRAYWAEADRAVVEPDRARTAVAFEQSWFGAKSMPPDPLAMPCPRSWRSSAWVRL